MTVTAGQRTSRSRDRRPSSSTSPETSAMTAAAAACGLDLAVTDGAGYR